ncbi:MAG: hypothetical protein ABFD80_11520, partial [Acidobacteriota bacterium]
RQTLSNLLTEISFDQKTTFDHQFLEKNYRFILLNLLAREPAGVTAVAHLARIVEEWERIDQEQDFEFLNGLFEVLESRAGELGGEPSALKLRKSISDLVEMDILRGDVRPELDQFIEKLGESVHDRQDYFDRIFKDKVVTPTLLKACFRFFVSSLDEFDQAVKRRASDSDLLGRLADSLKFLDTPTSMAELKTIYPLGDAGVKVRVLQAMQNLQEFDEVFLFSVLGSKNPLIQAEALILLMRHERTRHVAISTLFKLQSPYGIRNKALLRHIRIVEERDLRAADPYIDPLAQRRDFWMRKVRQEAERVLEKWRER